MAEEKSELNIVTEIGSFGSLNIEDPTVKKVKKGNKNGEVILEDLDEIIQESVNFNKSIKEN